MTGSGWPTHPRRIAPVQAPDEAQQLALAKTPSLPDGTVRNLFRTVAWHPTLLKRFNAFAGTFMVFSEITAYEREVVVLRVATIARSRYELAQHVPIALAAGISEASIRSLLAYPTLDALDEGDRMLASLADEMLTSGTASDALWADLAARFAEPALVELVMLVGQYKMVADLLNTLGVELENDLADTLATWLPA